MKDYGLWEAANLIEEISLKIDGVSSVLSILVERVDTAEESSAIWLMHNTLNSATEQIQDKVRDVMYARNQLLDELEKADKKAKKGKK